jgi:hypothetical protein
MKLLFSLLFVMVLSVAGCAHLTDAGGENPSWIDSMIARFQSSPVGNPPQSIWRYEYRGQIVYYVPAQCCDQYSMLFDRYGKLLCAPDGGITGGGDKRCPDFFNERKNETLIWSDPRGSMKL